MAGDDVKVDPDQVAGLGNDMLSTAMRLRSAPTAVSASSLADLGRAGSGSALPATYASAAQTAGTAVDAVAGALETNGTYVLYAAQNADDAFN